MPVRVLPRETAAAVIAGGVAVMGWAVAAATIVFAAPVLAETLLLRGRGDDLALPLLLLAVELGAVVAVAARPRVEVLLAFYLVAVAATFGYQVVLLSGDPGLLAESAYLANRPALALVAVGIPGRRRFSGPGWAVVGLAAALVTTYAGSVVAGVEWNPGWGPFIVFALVLVAHASLAAVQYRLRRRVPNFEELEAETLALSHGVDLTRRTAAVVHDTVLNDLALVMNAPDRLDAAARERLRADLETLRGADWIQASGPGEPSEERDLELQLGIQRLVDEFRWRGLALHVTGNPEARYRLTSEVVEAVLGAMRAALENVLRHSGTIRADLELIVEPGALTVMVTDHGVGFDPAHIESDRLGLRGSLRERIATVDGVVRVWSAPGEGTSVVISVPIDAPVES